MSYQIIDLNNLTLPKIIDELDFETLLNNRKTAFIDRFETEKEKAFWQNRLQFESEPVVKLLEENTYLELLLRTHINEKAKAVMLAFASGSDLDHLGALLGVERLLLVAEDLTQNPPISAEYESDDRFRTRIQMSLESITTAGSRGSYEYHALTASAKIKDVDIASPEPGVVQVTLLSNDDRGIAEADLIDTVKNALNAEKVRPLTDTVKVQSAHIVEYQINAVITLYPSVLESVVFANVQSAVKKYVEKQHALGFDITLSGIYAALHQEGVQNVVLNSPSKNIDIAHYQAAFCTDIQVTLGGRDE
ncbi:baseplate assembly protein [Caviibacterium pharyngocola]|uniref:Baseplate assembly protein n=1 Tax=Caviibacterium pharyngocola TaxID=28159 RepID=A0A2M8RTC1_9PAST|nr:baseplate J/gp47 family protein [Caviibacterium pharyngocola]PJG82127.1 baseplate assembly protein [Caviibacterium pharyngocola]